MKLFRIAVSVLAASLLVITWSASRGPHIAPSLAETLGPMPAKKFAVGIGPARAAGAPVLRGATAPGGTLTVARVNVMINNDGSQIVQLIYTNASGIVVSQRTLNIDSACTRVLDNFGNVVSATGPTAECTAATSFAGQVDTTIGNAASGGKLNL